MTTATENYRRSRRVAVRAFSLFAVMVLALVGPGAAPAASSTGLAGNWNVTISIYAQDPPFIQHGVFTFGQDQKLTTVNAPGEPAFPGEGVWTSRGDTFSFVIMHDHPDENGNRIGRIYANHLGKVYRGRFATTAFAFIVLDFDGTWIGPIPVRAEGTRVR